MTTTQLGVYGTQQGYTPGSWNNTIGVGPNPGDPDPHGVGTTRFGQRCELRIVKSNPADPEVIVRVCASAQNYVYSQIADGGVLVSSDSPPLEIYDPYGGVAVAVRHAYSTGSAFSAELYPVDGSRNKGHFPTMLVGESTKHELAATAITVAKPPATSKDLLVAFVGVMDSTSPAPTPTIPSGLTAGDPAGTWLDLGVIFAGANPTIHCYARVITGADPANYTWSDPAGSPQPRRWGAVIKAFRTDGATDLNGYGLGTYGLLGVPNIATWARRGTTASISPTPEFFGNMQQASLGPLKVAAEMGQPFLAVCCFGIDYGDNPGALGTFHVGQSSAVFTPTSTDRVTSTDMAQALTAGPLSADSMFSVGQLLVPSVGFEPVAAQLGTLTPWRWQGTILPLPKL